jgi:hypothetical protein
VQNQEELLTHFVWYVPYLFIGNGMGNSQALRRLCDMHGFTRQNKSKKTQND